MFFEDFVEVLNCIMMPSTKCNFMVCEMLMVLYCFGGLWHYFHYLLSTYRPRGLYRFVWRKLRIEILFNFFLDFSLSIIN